ncbi:sporulation integral membrane protein YtvI [Paenalkalicoccus suaedae]|uniref:Sporulation integral membrane protein YtvI n=1 Tax=Paenalkalicoccus suaedae TaxID=2592382 RepID=A0A859FFC0_9BACI|nr:sporulation integral membrane protein YtvI [Paenalkalicoccus suaedae]QKS71550.1 sporulation integral membrane protein YtvI [Paenalkalicoccus suaedae]
MTPQKKKTLYILLGVILIALLLYFVLPVSLPLILAFITALFLSPAVKALESKTKLTRTFSVFIVFMLFVATLAIITYFALTRAITQLNSFIENLPNIINDINVAWMVFLENLREQFDYLSQDIVNDIDRAVTMQLADLRDTIQSVDFIGHVTNILIRIPSYIVSLLVYLIALFMFLVDLPRLKTKLFGYFKEETAEKVRFMSARLSYVIFGFFKAQFLVSIIIFVVSFIGLLIIAPEVALIMSIIIWLIDFVPIIGSIVILAPWALYHLMVGNPSIGIQLLVLAFILLAIRRTVEPKVMGHHIGLSPLATLISLYVGLMLFGAIGFVLGPLAVILFTSAREAGIIKLNFKI